MAHNLDMSNSQANIAFRGSRNDVWHQMGQEMQTGMTIDQWASAAGLGWSAVKLPAAFILPSGESQRVEGQYHIVRDDTLQPLGYATGVYQMVQPREVLDWFDRYIHVDERFQLDVAGSLRGGAVIWATATFNGPIEVAGSEHRARLLMTTTFDQTGATINKGTMTRVVCNNTLDAALSDARCTVRTRHNTKFDARRVGAELAVIAKSFDQYKAIGDAMGVVELAAAEVSAFFKACLDIPFDAKSEDISTRKLNQFSALSDAYRSTVLEGTEKGKVWTALNAVTRYIDHDRSTRGTENGIAESRFASAQFGSGAGMKAKAWDLLLPLVKDKVALAA